MGFKSELFQVIKNSKIRLTQTLGLPLENYPEEPDALKSQRIGTRGARHWVMGIQKGRKDSPEIVSRDPISRKNADDSEIQGMRMSAGQKQHFEISLDQ